MDTDAQRLADETANKVWRRLLRVQSRLEVAMSDRLRVIGLSAAQAHVLTMLADREGMTQKEIGARLYVTKGNVSGLIDRLEGAGLVERRALLGDKRAHSLHLTPAGQDLAALAKATEQSFVRETLGLLPPERLGEIDATLLELRDRIRKAGRLRRLDRTPSP